MVKSVAKTVEKWDKRVSVAGPDYVDGIRSPEKDWEAESLAAKDRYEAELATSISEGRREAGIRKAGTAKWKSATEAKAKRWPDGVRIGKADYGRAMGEVLSFEDGVQRDIAAMPKATLEDRIARSIEWQRRMAEFKKR